MTAPATAQKIELWSTDRLVPYTRNPRTHSDAQVAQIAASIVEFGFTNPILVDSKSGIVAGHGRLLAARKLNLAEVPVIVLDHLSDTQRRAYILADNRLAEQAGWDRELLSEEFAALADENFDLSLTGFSDEELAEFLRDDDGTDDDLESEESIPPVPSIAATKLGDVWQIGPHRLVCGDCRDRDVVARLLAGKKANVVFTSPPYATQREYDPASGFRPVPPSEYVEWFQNVAETIASILPPDGSYFLNIKEHAEDGQRHLYVKHLIIAHVRKWGWRFVDELCWRKTDNGVPGGWNNRFKNAWEPVFHFCREPQIKFRPDAVSHISDGCFDYSPDNPKSASGSGLLGAGGRGSAAGRAGAGTRDGHHEGLARPSNVIEAKTENTQGSHSAPFPRALAAFFIKAFSDTGDIVFDPFVGSGTTIVSAGLLDRVGYGIEISPAYCDVAVQRLMNALNEPALLAGTDQAFSEIAEKRGVAIDPRTTRHAMDSRAIRHKNGMPYYGPRKRK